MLCQFCLGRKQSSDQLLRIVLNSTSVHWNVTPPKCQPLPWEGGRQPGAEGGMAEPSSLPLPGADTLPSTAHRVSHRRRTSRLISA